MTEVLLAGMLILLHSEQPKLYGVLAILNAIGLNRQAADIIISNLKFKQVHLPVWR